MLTNILVECVSFFINILSGIRGGRNINYYVEFAMLCSNLIYLAEVKMSAGAGRLFCYICVSASPVTFSSNAEQMLLG